MSAARGIVLALLVGAAAGCGTAGLALRGPPPEPFDVAIVPGCPSQDDGALSLCQVERAAWATMLWERGWAKHFITSGAAVHSPYVEAEAIAAGMAAMGVPADRIYLEPHALHTDENMYDSLQIARALGWRTVAVASSGGHAVWACRMLIDWGQPCRALPSDRAAVIARHRAARAALDRVRTGAEPGWVPLAERERRMVEQTGRSPRPPSYLLYPALGWLRLSGQLWIPQAPERPTIARWSEVAGRRAVAPVAPGGGRAWSEPCDRPGGLCF
jgi:hypothetical protein